MQNSSTITRTTGTSTRWAVLALTCLLAGLVPAAVSHADDSKTPGKQHHSETCRGVRATHVNESGGKGNDVIVVTVSGYVIHGGDGDDLICVQGLQSYADGHISGDGGDDTILTYSGHNSIYGGDGNDTILSNSSDYVLNGDGGDDTIYMGGHPDDHVNGGPGNDTIFGTPFDDVIQGWSGDDLIIGFAGNDRLYGELGNDRLVGREGTDTLDGQQGDDTCIDEAAPDTTFILCETIVGLATQGPGGLHFG